MYWQKSRDLLKKVKILSGHTSNFKNQILDIGHIKCKNLPLHCPAPNIIIITLECGHMQNSQKQTSTPITDR